jgi:N-acetylglucosamine PTS system EIICBA or EIICB component
MRVIGITPINNDLKEEKSMKFLQKLGKALMLPVAVLPICGILMGIGYMLCPEAMQGGDIQGAADMIGLFLVKAGGALIDNMAILFVIGVGVGMSDKNDGTGGIAALASWLMMTTLLSTKFVTVIIPSIADSATKTLAFNKIENPFIGILAGIIGAMCYNKFKDTKLPNWLSFFSGKRCVAIVSGVVSILVSVVLLFVWPLLFSALVSVGKAIVKLDIVGAGIYAFLNRLLIPTGLHHALNNVFWFDTIGLGDLQHFWAGQTSSDVSWSLGMYMSGFFPCMMFGVPGAALAMIKCAKPAKKKVAIGLVASAALCAFICGVTEPFEFGFMFLAPGLYVIYALLYGIFTMITVALGFLTGLIFKGLHSIKGVKKFSYYIASLCCPLLNTLLFMSSLVLFFYNTDYVQAFVTALGAKNPLIFVVLFVGVQGLIEAGICFIVASVVSRALYAALKLNQN